MSHETSGSLNWDWSELDSRFTCRYVGTVRMLLHITIKPDVRSENVCLRNVHCTVLWITGHVGHGQLFHGSNMGHGLLQMTRCRLQTPRRLRRKRSRRLQGCENVVDRY